MLEQDMLRNRFDEMYFISLDKETQALTQFYNLPWELGFQINKGHQLIKKVQHYIKWPNNECKVSKDAARITGYNHQLVMDTGKDPGVVLDELNSYLYNSQYYSIGTNILCFDALVHNYWRNKLGYDTDYSWLERLFDTHLLSKAYKLQLTRPPDESFLIWQFKLSTIIQKGLKTGIAAMTKELEIPYDAHHQASEDVKMSFEIFKKLIWKMEI